MIIQIEAYGANEVLKTAKANLSEAVNLYKAMRPNRKSLESVGMGLAVRPNLMAEKIGFLVGIIRQFEPDFPLPVIEYEERTIPMDTGFQPIKASRFGKNVRR